MAAAKTIGPPQPEHYAWCFPGSPLKVHLSLQVVQRLRQRLDEDNSAPDEGLLFGKTCDGVVEVLDFRPAGDASARKLVAALNAEGKRSLIGYYRTEDGEALCLNAQDRSLAEECFAEPEQVFLMIRSGGLGSHTATFFFHDATRRMVDFAFLEFPFDPDLLSVEEQYRIQRSHEAAIARPVVLPAPATVRPSTDDHGRKENRILKAAVLACCLVLVFAAGMAFGSRLFRERLARGWAAISNPPATVPPSSAPAPATPPASMTLHAIRQNGDLLLAWNGESPLIAAATSGELSIQDGASKRLIALEPGQLRSGSLLYSPTSDQILMKLSASAPSGTVTETVTVILPKVGQPKTSPVSVVSAPLPAPQLQPKPEPIPAIKASRPFTAPTLTRGDQSPVAASLQEAPLPRNGIVGQMPAVALPVELPGPTPPPAPAPPPASAEPLQQPASTTVAYEPPVPVVKSAPRLPPELRNVVGGPTTVQVNVSINQEGRVTKADAIPMANVSKFLLNFAANAALSWRFQPARRNNVPVSSESTVQFVFNR